MSEWAGVDRRVDEYERRFGDLVRIAESGLGSLLSRYSGNPLTPMLAYALEGGKRIRPVITMLVYDALGPSSESPYAASLMPELLHTISVVHDDIIDKEKSRRGRKPFYQVYGIEASLLLADFAFSIILDIASTYANKDLLGVISRAAMMMAEGEERERRLLAAGAASIDEYVDVIGLKTGSLFEAAAEIGAVLSSSPGLAAEAAAFGWHMGVCYQLADDLEDVRKGEAELIRVVRPAVSEGELLEMLSRECALAASKLRALPPSAARDDLEALVGFIMGSPGGIRTPVAGSKGRHP